MGESSTGDVPPGGDVSSSLYRQLFESAHDAIIVFTADTEVVLEANQRACEMYGFSRAEFVGMSLRDLSHDFERGQRETQITLQTGYYRGFETIQYRRDGTPMHLELNSAAIDFRGEVAILTVARDVTDRKEAQAREQQLQARVGQQQRLAAVGQFATGIAHDFNNLLQAIFTGAELAASHPELPEGLRATLESIEAQAERGGDLVRRIMAFSRAETPRQERLDLRDVVRDTARLLERILPTSITVTVDAPDHALWIDGDPMGLQQALTNLAVNARDAMPDGGRLAFEATLVERNPGQPTAAGPWVRVEVRDDGAGMAAEVRDRIFEPFFTTKPRRQGTGLGLAQVYGVVTQHQGHIEVDSGPGRGSSFCVYLVNRPAVGPAVRPAVAPTVRSTAGGGRRVLVVDDDPVLCRGLARLLGTLGYEATAAGDGAQAMERFEPGRFDLVLSDLVMPDVGGLDLFREIRGRDPTVPFVIMSGYPMQTDIGSPPTAQPTAWLRKPFSRAQVSAVLDDVLGPIQRRAGTR